MTPWRQCLIFSASFFCCFFMFVAVASCDSVDLPSDPLLPNLEGGDFLTWLTGMFTSRIGELFYVFLAVLIWVPLYIRAQSVTLPSIVWILLGSLIISAVPAISSVAVALMVFGFAGLLLKLFTREEGD